MTPRNTDLGQAAAQHFRVSQDAWGQIVAILSVVAAFLLKVALEPLIGQQGSPFLLFPAAIMLSAWYGGWKSGVTSTLLSTMIINWLYLPPYHSFWIVGRAAYVRLGIFLLEGGLICLLAENMHRHRRLAEHRATEAESARRTAFQREADVNLVRQQLSSRDAVFRHLVDANVVGVIVCRLDGRIVDANKAFLEMVEATNDDLVAGRVNWRQLTPPEFRDLDASLIQQLDQNGRFGAAEKEYMLPSGKRVPVLVAGAYTPDKAQVICFVLDRTLQQQAQTALIQAKEAAERSNRTRGEFLANVSHELRTPMNAILGMTELSLDEELPPRLRDYLETSMEASRTLRYLLDDLLDFSRMEAGRFDFESAPFSLRNTVDQAMRIMSLRAAEKALKLTCHVADDVPNRLWGDQGRLRQIVFNLVGNAIKFTPQGVVHVSLSRDPQTAAGDAENAVVRLSVKDTGIGISAENQARIFEPFTQVDASSTRSFGGAGLGLAIVRELVFRMGGQIAVESREGEGAQFTVTLPFQIDVLMHALADPAAPVANAHKIHETRRTVRVLAVEDAPANRKVVKAILEKRGHHVTLTANGREAVDQLLHEPFDVVLMDVQMPVLDGLDATRQIRRLPHRADVPIVAMTAHAMRGDREKCLAAGMDEYLSKPLDAQELIRMVERLAGKPPRNRHPSTDSLTEPTGGAMEPHSQSASTTPDAKLIDREAALARMAGDATLLREMAGFFIQDAPGLFQTLQAEPSSESALRAAHSLRGLACNFGAAAVVELAGRLESANLPPDVRTQALLDLEQQLHRLLDELRTVANEQRAS
ncbi:MAG: ATP-binding protein [Planctomycetaceae bacterium]|nr:ATP-binding protein [Planctomycetaceae bacterium]